MTQNEETERIEGGSDINESAAVAQPKKKRGRPSKAELEARALAEKAAMDAADKVAMDAAEDAVSEAADNSAPEDSQPEDSQPEYSADVVVETELGAVKEEPVKKRRGRRTKAEILAAAEAAAAAMSQKQAAAQLELEFPEVKAEPVDDPQAENMPESMVADSVADMEDGAEENAREGEQLALLEQLQKKVEEHNAENGIDSFADEEGQDEEIDTEWEGDPGDGTDFIIISDLPVEDNAAIPYYDMFDNPTSMVTENSEEECSADDDASAFDFGDLVTANGLLEVMPDGYGFLRSSDYNYLSSPDDVHLTNQQIKQYSLKTGDVVQCKVRPPRDNEKFFVMSSMISVNGRDPHDIRDRISFENLTPLFPQEKFNLCGDPRTTNKSTRVVDMFSPIGKGQRSLIVAQPKTGKTILMKDIANAIAANHPEAYIMMLLIDERPEEVTDMARTVNAEVIASTFDEPADRHVKIAGLVLEKAKRMVECGHDVVIFLDSITRLARAYNTVAPASGKVLTGGVDANALQKPKRFFGAARNIENGGSLTIIATALTDTGSKMDEVIFEEFKGTGNSELQLDRQLANRRIFPAVNLVQSSTRRDDLLLDDDTVRRMWIMRNHIADMNATEAMNLVDGILQKSRDLEEFFKVMNS